MIGKKWIVMTAGVLAILALNSVAMAGTLSISGTPYRASGFGGGEFVIYNYSGITPATPVLEG